MPMPFNYDPISKTKEPETAKRGNKTESNNLDSIDNYSFKNPDLKIQEEVNIINEIPTKDKTSSSRSNHKRRAFAHIITSSQSNARQN